MNLPSGDELFNALVLVIELGIFFLPFAVVCAALERRDDRRERLRRRLEAREQWRKEWLA